MAQQDGNRQAQAGTTATAREDGSDLGTSPGWACCDRETAAANQAAAPTATMSGTAVEQQATLEGGATAGEPANSMALEEGLNAGCSRQAQAETMATARENGATWERLPGEPATTGRLRRQTRQRRPRRQCRRRPSSSKQRWRAARRRKNLRTPPSRGDNRLTRRRRQMAAAAELPDGGGGAAGRRRQSCGTAATWDYLISTLLLPRESQIWVSSLYLSIANMGTSHHKTIFFISNGIVFSILSPLFLI